MQLFRLLLEKILENNQNHSNHSHQIKDLSWKIFTKDEKYPSDTKIEQLAQQLDVNFDNVLNWFKNRRSKGPSKKNKKN